MTKLLTLKLSDDHRVKLAALRDHLKLSSDVDAVRYWCDHGMGMLRADLQDVEDAALGIPPCPTPVQDARVIAAKRLAEISASPQPVRALSRGVACPKPGRK